jgi:hypothetical protein
VTITLRVPLLPVAAALAALMYFLGHVRASVPLAGPVPVSGLVLAAALTVTIAAAAVAVWLVIAGRPYRAPRKGTLSEV